MYMVEGYGEQNPIVEKSQFVMSLIEQIDKRGVGPQHKSIIDRCTALVYPEAEKIGRVATLCDLRNKLLEQPEDKAKEIALSLELYTTGSLDIFGRESTVDLNKPYVVFDIHGLGRAAKACRFPGHHRNRYTYKTGQAHPCVHRRVPCDVRE